MRFTLLVMLVIGVSGCRSDEDVGYAPHARGHGADGGASQPRDAGLHETVAAGPVSHEPATFDPTSIMLVSSGSCGARLSTIEKPTEWLAGFSCNAARFMMDAEGHVIYLLNQSIRMVVCTNQCKFDPGTDPALQVADDLKLPAPPCDNGVFGIRPWAHGLLHTCVSDRLKGTDQEQFYDEEGNAVGPKASWGGAVVNPDGRGLLYDADVIEDLMTGDTVGVEGDPFFGQDGAMRGIEHGFLRYSTRDNELFEITNDGKVTSRGKYPPLPEGLRPLGYGSVPNQNMLTPDGELYLGMTPNGIMVKGFPVVKCVVGAAACEILVPESAKLNNELTILLAP